MARLSAKARKNLPAGDFAGPGRSFPMEDKAHAEKAVQLEKYASPATRAKINARARAMGVDVGGDGKVFADHHQATNI
jgi:hypothetical protein